MVTLKAANRWHQRYHCRLGNHSINVPALCSNLSHKADRLEAIVWSQVEEVLSKPEVVVNELQRRIGEAKEADVFKEDFERIETQLTNRQK